MFKYKIFPEEKLIVVKVFGAFQLNDIIAWVEALSNDSNFSKGYDGFVDFREAKANLSLQEVKQVADYVVSHKTSTGKWVSLSDRPQAAAFSEIYKGEVDSTHDLLFCTFLSDASTFLNRDLEHFLQEMEFEQ